MSRRTVLAIVLWASLWSQLASAETPQVRVVWTEDPAHQAVVSWTSRGKFKTAELAWDTAPRDSASAYTHHVTNTLSGLYDDDDAAYYHHAPLSGLPADGVVHFRVITDGEGSRDYWFRTGPSDSNAFTLLCGGDSRSDSRMRRTMNERMRELVADDPSIIALVHGGDYVGNGTSWTQWNRWLDDWQETIGPDGRVLPIIPARGNHEGDAELYNVVFGFPGPPDGAGEWYLTRIGRDFALITLDSNVSQGGVQRTWLDTTLRSVQDARWIAANYHRPAYPAVKSPGGALHHWVPLFEQYNLDFVLESDGHVLKRTVPIRSDHPDPTGVVYLGEGGLGVPQRTADTSRWYLQPPGMAMSSHHVQLFRVTSDKVSYRAVDAEGEIIDRYEFQPKRVGHAEDAPPTMRALPVGKPPPPPAPPATQCTTGSGRSIGISGWLLLISGTLALARARRSTGG